MCKSPPCGTGFGNIDAEVLGSWRVTEAWHCVPGSEESPKKAIGECAVSVAVETQAY